jgi:hypothetical protein
MTPAPSCPVCGGEDCAAVGRPPPRPFTGHSRACPVRGPLGQRPRRVPRETWRPPPVIGVPSPPELPPVAAPLPVAVKREHAIERRAQGATYPQIAAELSCSVPHAWMLANGKR